MPRALHWAAAMPPPRPVWLPLRVIGRGGGRGIAALFLPCGSAHEAAASRPPNPNRPFVAFHPLSLF
ncbi:MAG: hypothetical protein IPL99_25235 [Candidatus Competibacteraceae bacterium]|nr:hypothetical protein [Candidatus Competibacteraceae bacterium]